MSHQITLQTSGHTFEVKKNEFILDAALRQGINFPYGCRTGSCGTCLGRLISGELEYPDGLPITLMEHEVDAGKAIFCTSIAKSDLLIDVKEITSVIDAEIKVLPARVASLRKLSDDVMEMKLSLPASERLAFRAGQYIEFILRDKSRRAFSLANAPSDDEYLELHLRLIKGGKFTEHVFNTMKEKALVRIEGAFGSFSIEQTSNRPIILIAGGTGFAPIKSMLEQLIEEGDTRPVHLYWGVKKASDLYHHELVKMWLKKHASLRYIPVLSAQNNKAVGSGLLEGLEQQFRTGYAHEAITEDIENLADFDVYIAGPPAMVFATKQALLDRGLPGDQLLFDSFEFS